MNQPPGFEDGTNRVCRLSKSLYGLRQAPRCFNRKLSNVLKSLGFTQSNADNCLYYRHGNNGELTLLAVYVDDGILSSTHEHLINNTIDDLRKHFTLKSGALTLFLGLHIHIDQQHNIWLNQYKYIKTILDRFNMKDCRGITTPADASIYQLSPAKEPPKTERPYRAIIGTLMFLAISTRPDICFATSYLARFLENYTEAHWNAALRVLRYLQNTANLSIVYRADSGVSLEDSLNFYSDSDYAADHLTRKSVSGSIALLAGGPILYSSTQQRSVSLSTTESEFYAITDCAKSALWLRTLFSELKIEVTPVIFVDNQSALKLIHNPEHHKRVKHIAVRFLFVRETAERNQIIYRYLCTSENLSDELTKPLPRPILEKHRSQIIKP